MKSLSLLLVILSAAVSSAQTTVDTTYRVELTATASPMISFFRNPSVPGTPHEVELGAGIFIRGMWHPGRLLSIGLLTGYMLIDQDDISVDRSLASQLAVYNYAYRARLTAIPLQLAISMQKHDIELGVGIGPYMMLSSIEGGNTTPSAGSRLELGLTFFGSYSFPLGEHTKIGPEFRLLYLRYRGIISYMPSCSLRIDIVRY